MTCTEARETLRSVGLKDSLLWAKSGVITAMNHYGSCRECLQMGLASIVDRTLSCQEAIEAHFQLIHPTNLYLSLMGGEIWQTLVHDHVWGRSLCLNPEAPYYKKQFEAIAPGCDHPVCQAIVANWDLGFGYAVPLDPETYGELVRRLPSRVRPLMIQHGMSTDKVDELVKGWHS